MWKSYFIAFLNKIVKSLTLVVNIHLTEDFQMLRYKAKTNLFLQK